MQIKVNFENLDEPTAKQIDLVQAICRKLNLGKPKYTKEEYSLFITNNIDEFYYEGGD